MSALAVGQTLYHPKRNGCAERTLTIAKIGRVYATFDGGGRCTINGLMLDRGLYSPHQLYLSKEIYEEKIELGRAWRDLARHMEVSRPARVTLENINKARALLTLGGEA
jgi:hypothetical protein